jgi:hypothetical protein
MHLQTHTYTTQAHLQILAPLLKHEIFLVFLTQDSIVVLGFVQEVFLFQPPGLLHKFWKISYMAHASYEFRQMDEF